MSLPLGQSRAWQNRTRIAISNDEIRAAAFAADLERQVGLRQAIASIVRMGPAEGTHLYDELMRLEDRASKMSPPAVGCAT